MSLLSGIAGGLGLIGQAGTAQRNQMLTKKLLKAMKNKQTPLEIPDAYKKLMGSINDQYLQAGDAQKNEITQQFGQNLAHVLGQLQMRGLSSSNLTANLSAGSQKRQAEAIANAQQGLLSGQLGAQQSIGLQGLSQVSGERANQFGLRANLLGQVAQPLLTGNQNGGLAGLLQGGVGVLSSFA